MRNSTLPYPDLIPKGKAKRREPSGKLKLTTIPPKIPRAKAKGSTLFMLYG